MNEKHLLQRAATCQGIIAELEQLAVPTHGFYLTQLHDAIHNLRLLSENLTNAAHIEAEEQRLYVAYKCASTALEAM